MASAIDNKAAEKFASLVGENCSFYWERYRARQLGHLEGLALNTESGMPAARKSAKRDTELPRSDALQANRVFVVHGHDLEIKESVARFLEKIGIDAIIINEQPHASRTVIEKFEDYSDVGFAVVLITPDDVGALKDTPDQLQGRARQNVIWEFGFFVGKLGRDGVCVIYRDGVEMISNYKGTLPIVFDQEGSWKKKIATELVAAGLTIDTDGFLKS